MPSTQPLLAAPRPRAVPVLRASDLKTRKKLWDSYWEFSETLKAEIVCCGHAAGRGASKDTECFLLLDLNHLTCSSKQLRENMRAYEKLDVEENRRSALLTDLRNCKYNADVSCHTPIQCMKTVVLRRVSMLRCPSLS